MSMTRDRSPLAAELRRTELHELTHGGLPPQGPCERFGQLAAHLLPAPAAFAALLDGERYVLVTAHGLPVPLSAGQELPLLRPFCNAIVTSAAPLAVTDW